MLLSRQGHRESNNARVYGALPPGHKPPSWWRRPRSGLGGVRKVAIKPVNQTTTSNAR